MISSVEMRLTALTIASVEPCTSPRMTIGNSMIFDDFVGEHVFQLTGAEVVRFLSSRPWR